MVWTRRQFIKTILVWKNEPIFVIIGTKIISSYPVWEIFKDSRLLYYTEDWEEATVKDYKIYPKQFINDKIPIEKNRCFMLMPFSPEFDYIYGTIKKDLNDNGLICNRADEIAGSKPILNKILTENWYYNFII